jgi:hypothetical protein
MRSVGKKVSLFICRATQHVALVHMVRTHDLT